MAEAAALVGCDPPWGVRGQVVDDRGADDRTLASAGDPPRRVPNACRNEG
jgi:hypothetical protein